MAGARGTAAGWRAAVRPARLPPPMPKSQLPGSRSPALSKPLLGVIHLLPLPSAAGHRGMAAVLAAATRDALAFARGGATGLVVENFGDAPFHKGTADDPVPPDVPAALALAAHAVERAVGLPLAINCLRH